MPQRCLSTSAEYLGTFTINWGLLGRGCLDPSGGSGIGGAIRRSVYYSLIKYFSGGLLGVEGGYCLDSDEQK